jgi:hypothetical protein
MINETRTSHEQDSSADVRARDVEMQMTDDERFSLVVSVMEENPVIPLRFSPSAALPVVPEPIIGSMTI